MENNYRTIFIVDTLKNRELVLGHYIVTHRSPAHCINYSTDNSGRKNPIQNGRHIFAKYGLTADLAVRSDGDSRELVRTLLLMYSITCAVGSPRGSWHYERRESIFAAGSFIEDNQR